MSPLGEVGFTDFLNQNSSGLLFLVVKNQFFEPSPLQKSAYCGLYQRQLWAAFDYLSIWIVLE